MSLKNINNMDIEQYLVHQTKDFGIGNFINCTPAIQLLYKHFNKKINVLFDTLWVENMYKKCNFMNILDRNESTHKKIMLSSSDINQEIEDWRYQCNLIKKKLNIDISCIPHTYVDSHASDIEGDYVVVIRGMVNDSWSTRKDPGDEIYDYINYKIVEKGFKIVFIGTDDDYDRCILKMIKKINSPIIVLNDTIKSLGVINGATCIISNDTGMYHAAGALNKHIFVMWKDTNFIKNKSPGINCKFSMKYKWKEDFDNWFVNFKYLNDK